MQRSKTLRLVGAVAALTLLATACSGDGGEEGGTGDTGDATDSTESTESTEGGGEATGGSFSMGINEPKYLGPPQTVTESEGAAVAQGLWAPLVEIQGEMGDLEAVWGDDAPDAVAANVEGSEDASTWTITLKEGWTFHNGEEVTAQSYVDAWNWGAYGPNAADANYFFANIEGYDALNPAPEEGETEAAEPETEELSGLEVVDDYTFEITLAEPFRQYPIELNYTAFHPMPSEAYDDIDAYNEQPIGNGPYQMAEPWQHDTSVTLEKWEDYPGTEPNADTVNFQIYQDLNTEYNDLLAGNLDIIKSIPPERIDEATSQYQDQIFTEESSYFGFIGMPTYQEPFDDPQMRKALSMAIDRQAIIDNILKNGSPADDMMPPVITGYREGACGDACEFNPDEAQTMFEEAGGVDALPETLDIWFNSGAGHEPVYEAVKNQWVNNLGIPNDKIQFNVLEFAQILEAFEQESVTGPFRLAWVMDYPSPQNYLGNLLACNGSANYTGYCNEEADQLVVDANQAGSADEATDLYQQADDMYLEDLPIIPFYFREERGMHSTNVSNVQWSPFARVEITEVEPSQG